MEKNIIANRKTIAGAIVCSNVLSQTLGLMFSSKKKVLLFEFSKEKKVPIHTFFVFYPIDLVFLDKNSKIIEIREKLTPFSLYSAKNPALYIIEATAGFAKRNKLRKGTTLQLQ